MIALKAINTVKPYASRFIGTIYINVGLAEPVLYYSRVTGSFIGQVAKHSNTTIPNIGKGTEGIYYF
jgi:hypothetical protein